MREPIYGRSTAGRQSPYGGKQDLYIEGLGQRGSNSVRAELLG
jgi:hypothetical protein